MKKRILLVDDEQCILDAFSDLLKTKFNIKTAINSEKALRKLNNSFVPDILIADLYMRNSMNGLELIKIAKEKFPNILTILISASSVNIPFCQADRTLLKPIKPKDLFENINSLLMQNAYA